MAEHPLPNAASDVEMNQYVADRGRVNEDKIRQDDEIIEQFGEYSYGWHDSDAAGEAAKKGISEEVVREISADKGEPAWMLDMPMGYVRGGNKDHGRGNRIEGKLEPGQKVVVIEDLISTAGSCIEVVEALREAGADVLGVVSIFTYGMQKGLDRLAAANVTNYSLSNFNTLCGVAVEEKYITPEEEVRLKKFRANPSDESWMA